MLTFMSDQNTTQTPVLETLNSEMRCGLFTNKEGSLLIVHDKKIRSPVEWVEYDHCDESLSLIHNDGSIQELGLKIDKKTHGNLLHGKEVTIARIEKKEIKSSIKVPIVNKEY
jgi:hypothetical protein